MATSAAFFADLAGLTLARGSSIASNKARWKLRGEKYLRNYGGMRAGALITVDPAHQLHVLGLIEQIAPSFANSYDEHLGGVARKALRAWPRKSGLSASLLGLEYTTTGGGATFVGKVTNRAPYSWLIRYSGRGKYGEVVERLVFQPGQRAAVAIAQATADGLR